MTLIADGERAKYAAVWGMSDYSEASPGANFVELFMRVTNAKAGQTVADIGAGAGAGSRALAAKGLRVKAFDLVDTAWTGGDSIPLHTGCVWNGLMASWTDFDFGYCCDVMEHIPTQFVGLAVDKMLQSCNKVFFSISFNKDVHGDAVRDRLHLTIQSFTWWRDTMRELGTVIEARDLIGDGVFYVGR